ncbi:MAG: hypothetical protein LUC19_05055 [Oscillospiraceae bacterium]|nr:hypothetical protein [Oscillospiraceae bacterium]
MKRKRTFNESFIEYRLRMSDTRCEPIAFSLGHEESGTHSETAASGFDEDTPIVRQ